MRFCLLWEPIKTKIMKKILLISENEEAENILQNLGYETIVAFNPSQARQSLQQNPDAIIIDAFFLPIKETAKFVGRMINDYGFCGPMIASAKEEKSRLPLLKAGCQYEVSGPCEFSKVLSYILKK